jgi:methyl-accepting chemotaxis protein
VAQSKGKRRRNTLTRLVEDVLDDTKDLVDDVLDRTKDVEADARKSVRRALDEDGDDREDKSAREIDSLKSAIDDLTAKVTRLAELQAETARLQAEAAEAARKSGS